MTTRQGELVERAQENIFRIAEFRKWVDSNILFPLVPDSIVKPLRQQLLDAEHALVNLLYDANEFERVAAIRKTLAG